MTWRTKESTFASTNVLSAAERAPTHSEPTAAVGPIRDLAPNARAEPVYMIGDSQVAGYNFRSYGCADRTFVFQSVYGRLTARNWEGADGALSPYLIDLLTRARIGITLNEAFEVMHVTDDDLLRSIYHLEGRPAVAPTVVVCTGLLDCMYFSLELDHVPDVALPAELVAGAGPLAAASLAGAVPFSNLFALLRTQMEPLAQGLRQLRERGLGNLALLSVPPPTPDLANHRAELARLGKSYSEAHDSLRWRTILRLLMNAVFRSIAADVHVAFIDRWDDQTNDGVARPGLLADWTHLSAAACDATARAVLRDFVLGNDAPDSGRRYQIIIDDPGSPSGTVGHTIDDAGFAEIRRTDATESFVRVVDVNSGTTTWVNRSRILQIVLI